MLNKRRIWIYLLSGLLILSCGYLVHWLRVYQKYDKTFAVKAEAAVPKMGELNTQILSELPPPLGVKFISQGNVELWSPLGTRMYYVHLVAEYKIAEVSPAEIVSYYQELLTSNGRQASQFDLTDTSPHAFYTYYRGSAAIDLSVFQQEYILYIHHDFWGQKFSPPKPSRDIAFVWCNLHPPICGYPTALIQH